MLRKFVQEAYGRVDMAVKELNHINIRTAKMEKLKTSLLM